MEKYDLILARPMGQANIGAIARLASNFNFKELIIAEPLCKVYGGESEKYAMNTGSDVLKNVKVFKTLSESISAHQAVIGFIRKPTSVLLESILYEDLMDFMEPLEKVALVFGNERDGLSQEELKLITHTCEIPTSNEAPSLNLSHAVAIVAAKIFSAAECHVPLHRKKYFKPATVEEIDSLVEKLNALHSSAQIPIVKPLDKLFLGFKRFLVRASPTSSEIGLIHHFVTHLIKAFDKSKTGKN